MSPCRSIERNIKMLKYSTVVFFHIVAGLLSWSAEHCHVNLEEELHTITVQALEGEEGKNGEFGINSNNSINFNRKKNQ